MGQRRLSSVTVGTAEEHQTGCLALAGTTLVMRFLFLLLFSTYGSVLAAAPSIQFEPNKGQTDARVRYLARSTQGIVFFTDNQIVFRREDARAVILELKASNAAAEWESFELTDDETSYQVGRDPSR